MARPVPSSPQDVDRDQNWSITLYDKGIIRFNGHRMIRVLKNKQTNKLQDRFCHQIYIISKEEDERLTCLWVMR